MDAPCEAEAQCAELQKAGIVHAVATEDMDTMTFGSELILRNFNASESKKLPIVEISLSKALEELSITMKQFIDLCILLGCDYTTTIKGIGPKKSLKLIIDEENIENIIESLEDQDKYKVPKDWSFAKARELLTNPEVIKDFENINFQWKQPDQEGLLKFMVEEKGFNEARIKSSSMKLLASSKKSTQARMDSFFKRIPPDPKDNSKKVKKTKT